MIGKDYTFNRELVVDICAAKPVRDLKDLLNVPEYGQHLAEEHGAEESIVMGNTRNWQQSFRAQELIPKDAKLVLDLGCGRGYWTQRITSLLAGGKCIGTDIDEMFVNAGKKEFGLDLRVMDYHRLEFPDGVFDAIYADNCIEHSPRPDVVLMEINRVLKMGGTFILLIPPDKIGYPMLNNPYHVWKVDKKIMKESLEWAGFDIQEFIEFDLVKENALLYHESGNIMFIIKGKKIKNVV
jgi:SAM-dependent methyltransferase